MNILCREGKITGLIDFGNVLWTTKAGDLIKITTGEKEDIEETVLKFEKTKEQMQGREPKKVIVVPGKIVNIVG